MNVFLQVSVVQLIRTHVVYDSMDYSELESRIYLLHSIDSSLEIQDKVPKNKGFNTPTFRKSKTQ